MDIASISVVVAAGGVIVGVVFAYLEVRNLAKTRQTELLMRLYSDRGKEFWEAWEKIRDSKTLGYIDYKKEYGFVEHNYIASFYEGVGALLQRKLIDIGLVQDLFGSDVAWIWEKLRLAIEDARKMTNRPAIYRPFEYLYNEMQKREQTLQTQR